MILEINKFLDQCFYQGIFIKLWKEKEKACQYRTLQQEYESWGKKWDFSFSSNILKNLDVFSPILQTRKPERTNWNLTTFTRPVTGQTNTLKYGETEYSER